MKTRSILFMAGLLIASAVHAKDVLITNGRIITMGPAGIIESGNVLVRDGKIVAVGQQVTAANAEIVDANGGFVTPGFFDSGTQIGLGDVESSTIRTDQRVRETDLGAGFPIALTFDRNSIEIPIVRIEGVTRAIVRPSAGSKVFAGQSAIIQMSGSEATIVDRSNAVFALLGEGSRSLAGGSRAKALLDVVDGLNEALAYSKNRRAFEARKLRDLRQSPLDLEALIPIVEGKKPLAIVANKASDIELILENLEPFKLKLVIVGGAEAWQVAPLLADRQVPVVLNPLRNLPSNFDQLASSLSSAAKLVEAGVMVAFMTEEQTSEFRSLTQGAGVAVANGLAWQDALDAITINPAVIWGIEKDYGTLEPGMDADVVIWDGDPLEVMSAPTAVMIEGAFVDLRSRQTLLRDRYAELEGNEMPFGYR